jgi:hypothetical protein
MSMVTRSAVLMLAGCLSTAVAFADSCHAPSAPATFPEPATASEQDILSAQQSVKKYLADMEDTLKCLTAAHNDAGYNRAVDDMQKTAGSFNTVLRAFKARQKT